MRRSSALNRNVEDIEGEGRHLLHDIASKEFANCTLLLASLAFVLLFPVSGSGTVSETSFDTELHKSAESDRGKVRTSNSGRPSGENGFREDGCGRNCSASHCGRRATELISSTRNFREVRNTSFEFKTDRFPGRRGVSRSASTLLVQRVACRSWFSFTAGASWRETSIQTMHPGVRWQTAAKVSSYLWRIDLHRSSDTQQLRTTPIARAGTRSNSMSDKH